MNWKAAIFLSALALPVHAQNFEDLNFESAYLPAVPPGEYGGAVSISSALPGWSGYLGGSLVSQILQDDLALGDATIDIFGPQWTGTQPGIIDGDYSVYLQPGSGLPGTDSLTASIAQTGEIPIADRSLKFDAWQPAGSAPFTVSFAGNDLTPVVLSTGQSASGQDYDVYGVDISSYAGQTGALEFTAYPGYSPVLLDDIAFSRVAVVPEPSAFVLTGIGGLVFALRRTRTASLG